MLPVFRLATAVIGVFLASATHAATLPSFQSMDLFGLEWASEPQVSPDGQRVVYVRNGFDVRTDRRRSSLWLLSTRGQDHRPLVAPAGNASSPRWSPDGRRLAYVLSDPANGTQLHVTWLDTGVTARVADLTEAPSRLVWSPDNLSLAFVMRVQERREPLKVSLPSPPRGASWAEPLKAIDRMVYRADGEGFLPDAWRHVFVVPAEGGTPEQLTTGPYNHGGLAFTPDGRELIVSANRRPDADLEPNDSELHAIHLPTRELRTLTQRLGPDEQPAISPDGRYIAYTGYDERYQGYQRRRLYLLERASGAVRELGADIDRDLVNPCWDASGRHVYVQYDSQGQTLLAAIGLDGRERPLVQDLGGVAWSRPYTGASFSVSDDGTIAYTRGDWRSPADVAMFRRGSKTTQLTSLNIDLLARRQLAEIEEVWAESPADGRRIQAWILRPPGYDPARKYPLILEIHGGPFQAYGPHFAAELQLMAAAGYVVLYVNPRGSTSYGEEFGNLIHHAYPGQDYDDLMAAVDATIAKGGVDPNRLFVTGGSGGGVLTAWIVGKTDRFRAAAVQKPVINWTSFVLTADATNVFYRYWFGKLPWEAPEHYWARSPLSLVGNVKTPTMVVSGEADWRTPMWEAEQYYQALRLRGVETLLLRVPGAPHSLDQRPSQLASRIAHILAWFAKHDPAAQ